MNPFHVFLQQDPQAAKRQLLQDPQTSFWLKQAIDHLDRRDPVDVLSDLDVLINLYEALSDRDLDLIPAPHTRLRPLALSPDSPGQQERPEAFDQFAGEIEIGGTLDRLLVPDFLSVLSEASVGLGWETELFTPQQESDLFRAMDGMHHLHFFNSFAIEGEFPVLEDWLIAHQIGFTRTSRGSSSYQAERVQFRKGLTVPLAVALDPTDTELIPRQAIAQALRYVKEGQSEDAATLLELTLGPPLSALPSFRIEQTLQRVDDFF